MHSINDLSLCQTCMLTCNAMYSSSNVNVLVMLSLAKESSNR